MEQLDIDTERVAFYITGELNPTTLFYSKAHRYVKYIYLLGYHKEHYIAGMDEELIRRNFVLTQLFQTFFLLMKLSNVLSLSFQLFKTTFLTHLLGCLLLFGVLLGLYWFLAPAIFGMSLEEITRLSKQPEKVTALVSNDGFAIKLSPFLLLVDGIVTPFTAGMYKNCRSVQRNEVVTMGQLFSFYRPTYTSRILSYVSLLTALESVAFIGIGALGLPAFTLVTVTVMSIVFVLTLPIIVFEDQPLLRAMDNSYKCAVPVIFTVMFALILGGIVSLLGASVFGIDIVVTFPMLYTVIYSLYTNSVTH